MVVQRAPRHIPVPDPTPSVEGRRQLYNQALHASAQPGEPQGFVALVLVEVLPAQGRVPVDERVLAAVTTRLAEVLNRRLRSVDLLVRSASCELAVLLTLADIGVAAAFSERLRQPIEQALREQGMDGKLAVCMGLAANPPGRAWHPDELIELADFRMGEARRRARQADLTDWSLVVECATQPASWSVAAVWPVIDDITNDTGF